MRLPIPLIIAGIAIATAVVMVLKVTVLQLPYVGMGNFSTSVTSLTSFHTGWGKIDFVGNVSVAVYQGSLPILYAVYFPNGTLVNITTQYGEVWAFKNGIVCGYVQYGLSKFYVEFQKSTVNPNVYVATYATGATPSLTCANYLPSYRYIAGRPTLAQIVVNQTHIGLTIREDSNIRTSYHKIMTLVGNSTQVSATGLMPSQVSTNGVEVVVYPLNAYALQPSKSALITVYPRK
ncbi:MAG: hypothetical protein ABWK05_07160 [Pyrobaculum sp.]